MTRSYLIRALLPSSVGSSYFIYKKLDNPDSVLYPYFFLPILHHFMDAETSHHITLNMMRKLKLFQHKSNIFDNEEDKKMLEIDCMGCHFTNPIGLAAGFDKNAKVVQCMWNIGFGFVEVGSVVPKPQEGNPKPRIFRLKEDKAIINRCGFNSEGLDSVEQSLISLKNQANQTVNNGVHDGILGVNLGKNKSSSEEDHIVQDYIAGIERLYPFADYFVINISSPNTPNLRALQERKRLDHLLFSLKRCMLSQTCRDGYVRRNKIPLLIKIAPDLNDEHLKDIAHLAQKYEIDGIIISNTTIRRSKQLLPHTSKKLARESGGLSGKPLFDISNSILRKMYRYTDGKIVLIGSGGIFSGKDAYLKIRSGASLVQIYTGMIYEGPGIAHAVQKELVALLRKDGFKNVKEAIGIDVKQVNQQMLEQCDSLTKQRNREKI